MRALGCTFFETQHTREKKLNVERALLSAESFLACPDSACFAGLDFHISRGPFRFFELACQFQFTHNHDDIMLCSGNDLRTRNRPLCRDFPMRPASCRVGHVSSRCYVFTASFDFLRKYNATTAERVGIVQATECRCRPLTEFACSSSRRTAAGCNVLIQTDLMKVVRIFTATRAALQLAVVHS